MLCMFKSSLRVYKCVISVEIEFDTFFYIILKAT
jgi:hypothetical protein